MSSAILDSVTVSNINNVRRNEPIYAFSQKYQD